MYLEFYPDEVSVAYEAGRLINSVIQGKLLCAALKFFYLKKKANRLIKD